MAGYEHNFHIVHVTDDGNRTTGNTARAASSIPDGLIDAYLSTTYQLGLGGAGPSLRIGEPVGTGPGTVGGMMADAGATCAAFITAWNPHSNPATTDAENEAAHARLLDRLAAFPGVTVHEGEGVGENPEWAPERSVFAVGLASSDAISLGREFRQNAIVWVDDAGVPELLLLR
ncbi:MAG: DUF3293 domain-containing protein [Chloroflexi bacterium]|nr:DUF3293 domain-containing protein [Chloroflexota bacterium]